MSRIFCFILLLFFYIPCIVAQYIPKDFSYPKTKEEGYYISNPNQILSPLTVDRLNNISNTIDSISGVEFFIVIINDYLGEDIAVFSTELFNNWELGKEKSDKGLLLVVSKNKGEYHFMSGYGLEFIIPYKYFKRIGEKFLVPSIQQGNYAQGIHEAAELIQYILTSPDPASELQLLMPEPIGFWSLKNPSLVQCLYCISAFLILYLFVHIFSKVILKSRRKSSSFFVPILKGVGYVVVFLILLAGVTFIFYSDSLQTIFKTNNLPYWLLLLFSLILGFKLVEIRKLIRFNFRDEEKRQNAYSKYLLWFSIPLLLSPLAWSGVYRIFKRFAENRNRFTPPDDSGDWIRIVRRSNKDAQYYLSIGQQAEEKLQSRRYEIWRNETNGELITIPWDINGAHKKCPTCNFYTLNSRSSRVVRKATYAEAGVGLKVEKCEHCAYSIDKEEFVLSKLRLKSTFSKRKPDVKKQISSENDMK